MEGSHRPLRLADFYERFLASAPRIADSEPIPEDDRCRRGALLHRLIQRAVAERTRWLELTAAELEALVLPAPATAADDDSFDVNLHVFERGGATTFAPAFAPYGARAGAFVARFSPLLEPHELAPLREAYRSGPGTAFADLDFPLPSAPRLRNVAERRAFTASTLSLGTFPHAAEDRILANELYVTVAGDRFVIRRHDGSRVEPLLLSMLNTGNASPIVHFLNSIHLDGRRPVRALQWGELSQVPFRPGLLYRNVVLCRPAWRMTRRDVLDAATRRAANLPRYVSAGTADTHLVYDLESRVSEEMLRDELTGTRPDVPLEVLEACPAPPEYSLPDGDGARYNHEIVFSFAPRAKDAAEPLALPGALVEAPAAGWLYAKCYVPPSMADHFVRKVLHPALGGYSGARWFFVRYNDPQFHIRVRVELPEREQAELQRKLREVQREHPELLQRIAVDTYLPEYARYGGSRATVSLCEDVFWSSTLAFAGAAGEPFEDAVRTALDTFGGVRAAADAIIAIGTPRRLVAERRSLISPLASAACEGLSGTPALAALRDARDWRDDEWRSVIGSLLHMHFNRFDLYGEDEADALNVLRQALQSAAKRAVVLA